MLYSTSSSSSSSSIMIGSCFSALFTLLFCFAGTTTALTCYENDDAGNVYEKTNSTWTYCALIPPINADQETGRVFGMSDANDWVATYDSTFGLSDNYYKILTICILEKYDLSSMSVIPFPPEFIFRCVCNYDRCNSATTFAAYLQGVQIDNMPGSGRRRRR